jgi:hypothetical protein
MLQATNTLLRAGLFEGAKHDEVKHWRGNIFFTHWNPAWVWLGGQWRKCEEFCLIPRTPGRVGVWYLPDNYPAAPMGFATAPFEAVWLGNKPLIPLEDNSTRTKPLSERARLRRDYAVVAAR